MGSPLDAVRVDIHAMTASFRVPGMMGFQVTSTAPPPSTVYGILAAAAGREVLPSETWIAYRFEYDAVATDLETIIIYSQGGPVWDKGRYAPKTNVINRQFLFNARLTLYIAPGYAAESLLRPRFPLVLGRSQDVAYVASYREAQLNPVNDGFLSGVILPFPIMESRLESHIAGFATFFSTQHPRRPLAMRPFHVLDALQGAQHVSVKDLLYVDPISNAVVPRYTEATLTS